MTDAYKALSEIQKTLNAPKGQTNKFGGYKYRSCEDILQAVKPLLGDAVILVSDEIKLIGDRFYVEATARFMLGDAVIETKALAREQANKKGMDDAQLTGATSSYARKYALNGLLLIDDNKDADSQDNRESGAANQPRTQPGKKAKSEPLNQSHILKVMADGDDFATVSFWRGMSQESQEAQWKSMDKASQKHLKALMAQHPPVEKAS